MTGSRMIRVWDIFIEFDEGNLANWWPTLWYGVFVSVAAAMTRFERWLSASISALYRLEVMSWTFRALRCTRRWSGFLVSIVISMTGMCAPWPRASWLCLVLIGTNCMPSCINLLIRSTFFLFYLDLLFVYYNILLSFMILSIYTFNFSLWFCDDSFKTINARNQISNLGGINSSFHITFFMNPNTLPDFVFMLDSLPFLTAPFLKFILDGTRFLSPDLAPSPFVLQYLLLSIGNCFHISLATAPE